MWMDLFKKIDSRATITPKNDKIYDCFPESHETTFPTGVCSLLQ
jgi:hypothetical protein